VLLDELMGKDRDLPLDQQKKKRLKFDDPQVLKYVTVSERMPSRTLSVQFLTLCVLCRFVTITLWLSVLTICFRTRRVI